MSFLQVVVLSITQGLTEFLPISSSGHLVIISYFTNFKQNLTLDIFLHTGTLISVLLYYRKSISEILKLHKFIKIIIATIPAGIIGVFCRNHIESFFENINFVPIFLSITGLILYISGYFKREKKEFSEITVLDSVLIGTSQAIALLPGISRSGITIVCCLLLGIKKADAVKFSFYLSIPAILGATIIEVNSVFSQQFYSQDVIYYFLGIILSAISGYIAIDTLLKVLKNADLKIFSYYCFLLSIIVGIFILSEIFH